MRHAPTVAAALVLFAFAAGLGWLWMRARPEALHRIEDLAQWQSLAARPESSTTSRTEVVKFLVDLENDRTLWLVDTERWDVHFTYARDRLSTMAHPVVDHAEFNRREYHDDDRRFETGSIVHYVDGDVWTMELLAGDTLSGERIARLHAQLRDALYFGDQLRFFPRSPLHEAHVAGIAGLPIVRADEVMAGIVYQPLTRGTAFGRLRLVRGTSDPTSFSPDEIVVLEHLPDEIPVVAGVVSDELEAPLGHIAILCTTRGTPNMGLRDALEDPAIAALDGQLVALTVDAQDWSIRPASAEEAEAAWEVRRPAAPEMPPPDRTEHTLALTETLRLEDAGRYGAKAAQLGEVCSLRTIRTPGGFAIPFAYYLEHLEAHGIEPRIAALASTPRLEEDAAIRRDDLARLRDAIETAEIAPLLLDAVMTRLAERPDARWIFRSSTNAEDLAGFSGAGLYRSLVVPAQATRAEVAEAIAGVWASVWLDGAYDERAWYRVPHANVAMAILVQPFVDGASVNGVAITANPFTPRRPGFLVDAQSLGGSVTGAHGDEVPEQYLLYTFMDAPEFELLSRSSRTGGAPLLQEPDLLALTSTLALLHEHLLRRWMGAANAVDVELLLVGEPREVVVLQARPYTVRYPE